MTKQEVEKAIKNGESVWYVYEDDLRKIELTKYIQFNQFGFTNSNDTWRELYSYDKTFATKQQAEHYLHHANITRTEQLPFLTWEEFKNKYKDVVFTDPKGVKYYLKKCVFWCPETNNVEYCISIKYGENYLTKAEYDYTEANFYKAYDECVRLFRGEV